MLTGGCFCGRVRYEAHGTPYHASLCHCVDCRRVCGAPAVAWFTVKAAGLRVVEGSLSIWQSSASATRGFCGHCGSQITYQHVDLADEIDITTASLDDPSAVSPQAHIHTASRVPWFPLGDLPAYPGARDDGPV